MSTRALIEISDVYGKRVLYAHGDGYPSYMEKLIKLVIKRAKEEKNIPNLKDADKLTTYLIYQFYKEGYTGLYMSSAEIDKEVQVGSDIEYFYQIHANTLKLTTYQVGSVLKEL